MGAGAGDVQAIQYDPGASRYHYCLCPPIKNQIQRFHSYFIFSCLDPNFLAYEVVLIIKWALPYTKRAIKCWKCWWNWWSMRAMASRRRVHWMILTPCPCDLINGEQATSTLDDTNTMPLWPYQWRAGDEYIGVDGDDASAGKIIMADADYLLSMIMIVRRLCHPIFRCSDPRFLFYYGSFSY